MFNPNDLELTRHIVAFKAYTRDIDMLIREKREKELFLSMMLAQRSLEDAQDCLNRMNRVEHVPTA